MSLVDRAMEGRVLRPGSIVVKTTPSGADVILDGKKIGKTGLRLNGIDRDAFHDLVVTPEGMDPIQIQFGPEDFASVDGTPTYLFERNFEAPEPDAATPEPAADEPGKKPKKRKKRRRKRRRGG